MQWKAVGLCAEDQFQNGRSTDRKITWGDIEVTQGDNNRSLGCGRGDRRIHINTYFEAKSNRTSIVQV